jgi:hypothetical protein
VKRTLWLVPIPVAVTLIAAFALRSDPKATSKKDAPEAPAHTAPAVASPTWVATTTVRPAPRLDLPMLPDRAAQGPKPPTDSRTALAESHMPVVAALSIDRLGSPRERLLAEKRGVNEARQAQLDHLSGRAQAHIARLEAERAMATGADRKRLDDTLAKLKKNESMRSRAIIATVHSPMRPGAAAEMRATGTLPAEKP